MQVIAERTFELRGPAERTVVARVDIPEPHPEHMNEYRCPFQVVGLSDDSIQFATGVDAFQALSLAFGGIRRELRMNERVLASFHKDFSLTWEGRTWQACVPVLMHIENVDGERQVEDFHTVLWKQRSALRERADGGDAEPRHRADVLQPAAPAHVRRPCQSLVSRSCIQSAGCGCRSSRKLRTRNAETRMRKLRIVEHISLDGVMQHSNDNDDFPYSDWTARYRTPAGRDAVMALYGERFDLLLGRRTYDLWSGFWPTAPSSPMGDRLNAATKYVATHRPESLAWGPFEGVGPDLVEDISRIKSEDGRDLVISGSSTLTSALLEHGLADEVVLIVSPVLLGTGKRLFAQGIPARAFVLVDTRTTSTGVLLNRYEAAGPFKT